MSSSSSSDDSSKDNVITLCMPVEREVTPECSPEGKGHGSSHGSDEESSSSSYLDQCMKKVRSTLVIIKPCLPGSQTKDCDCHGPPSGAAPVPEDPTCDETETKATESHEHDDDSSITTCPNCSTGVPCPPCPTCRPCPSLEELTKQKEVLTRAMKKFHDFEKPENATEKRCIPKSNSKSKR